MRIRLLQEMLLLFLIPVSLTRRIMDNWVEMQSLLKMRKSPVRMQELFPLCF